MRNRILRESIERRLTNARTLVLMAACAYIPTDGTETTRQRFLSLERAVSEYRAAVRMDERSRQTKLNPDQRKALIRSAEAMRQPGEE